MLLLLLILHATRNKCKQCDLEDFISNFNSSKSLMFFLKRKICNAQWKLVVTKRVSSLVLFIASLNCLNTFAAPSYRNIAFFEIFNIEHNYRHSCMVSSGCSNSGVGMLLSHTATRCAVFLSYLTASRWC